jgi:hypothetical protein
MVAVKHKEWISVAKTEYDAHGVGTAQGFHSCENGEVVLSQKSSMCLGSTLPLVPEFVVVRKGKKLREESP